MTQTPETPLSAGAQTALEGLAFEIVESLDGIPCLVVTRDILHEVLTRLRDRADFGMLTMVTAIDRYPAEPRFEVAHQLLALNGGARVRVKTRLAADDAQLPTCTDLWAGASFMERECYDMFGVIFTGHPKLERLLMPDGYGHHPLRKDFPHQGIQPDRLYREWDRERRASWSPES